MISFNKIHLTLLLDNSLSFNYFWVLNVLDLIRSLRRRHIVRYIQSNFSPIVQFYETSYSVIKVHYTQTWNGCKIFNVINFQLISMVFRTIFSLPIEESPKINMKRSRAVPPIPIPFDILKNKVELISMSILRSFQRFPMWR